MSNNGFYAAMKTDTGVQTVYIDEETLRAQRAQAAEAQRRRKMKAAQRKKIAAMNKEQQAAVQVIKQELKLIGMGAVLYWGYTMELVAPVFMVPVLIAFQTVICFRAGRWFGHRDQTKKDSV